MGARMNAPPAICPTCGWEGPAPGIVAIESTGITFQGSSVSCPACGGTAKIVDGTYDFVGGVVRLARDADLTLADINRLRIAAKRARQSKQAPDDFLAANPELAPIVNLIVQQKPGRDWLVILLMVLAIIVPYLRSAEQGAQQQAHAATPTTLVLTDGEIATIEKAVEAKIERKVSAMPRPTAKPKKREKRPGKKYGRNKRHR
jgi:hypothetical protein